MAPLNRVGEKKPYQYTNADPRHMPYSRTSGTLPAGSTARSAPSESAPPHSSGSVHRPSRYNPSSTSRPHTPFGTVHSKPRTGSRYNPEPGFVQSGSRGSSETRRFPNSPNAPSSSRYSFQAAAPIPKASHHSYYNPQYSRRRPSSATDGYDPASHGYTARSKWKEPYGSASGAAYDGRMSPSNTSPVPPLSKPPYYNRYHGTTVHQNIHAQPYSSRYGHYRKEHSSQDSSYTTSNKFPLYENEHSLGSSLINSVPQTSRKTEERVSNNHERIDLQKTVNDDSVKREEPSSLNTTPSDTKSGQTDNADENNAESAPKEEEAVYNKPGKHDIIRKAHSIEDFNEAHPSQPTSSSDDQGAAGSTDTYFAAKPVEKPSHLPSRHSSEAAQGYTQPLNEVESCIFPLPEAETKLWELKNRDRESIVKNQKYLLKSPVTCLQEYPFMSQNILVHEQAVRPILVKSLSKLQDYERLRKLQLKWQFLKLDEKWTKNCQMLEAVSEEVKKVDHATTDSTEEESQFSKSKEKEEREQQSRASSRRRNRADFVDDNEIENVLLRIDPDYKHHQLAAKIPPMIIDPVKKFAVKYKDVNNLVTDKNKWATRVLRDGIDTFTSAEHDLFVEGYLAYPKRFGKISQFMGGLRKPQECVLHYYKTKKETNYKQLLVEKNKRRKINAGRRRREKDKEKTSAAVPEQSGQEAEEMSERNDSNFTEKERTMDETEDEEVDQGAQIKEAAFGPAEKVEDTSIVSTGSNVALPDGPRGLVQQQQEEVSAQDLSMENEEDTESKKRKIQEIEEVTNDLPNLQPIAPAFASEDKDATDIDESRRPFKADDNEKVQARKKTKHSDGYHKSSYWSVKETNLFPELLREYGTQWALISERLGTKSTTMVRNYFQRNADQMGWQALVESSNSESPENKLNTQFGNSDATPGAYDTVPMQQAPTVSIFSQIHRDAATPMQLPIASVSAMDSFSQQSTPQGLPPPRLPSIQLGLSTDQAERKPLLLSDSHSSNSAHAPEAMPSVHFAPSVAINNSSCPSPATSSQAGISSRRSSIKNLLNNDDHTDSNSAWSKQRAVELPPIAFPEVNATAPVVVQELRSSNFTSDTAAPSPSSNLPPKQPSFLNSILNAASAPASQSPHVPTGTAPRTRYSVSSATRPILPPVGLSTATAPTPARPREFNFANDPLAALAAVASAPEALVSLIPQDGGASNSSTQQKPSNTGP
ncbi:Snt1p [Lachancea thermotolerans CBS 6340]|uniref:KLTH0F03762p n=1 Tax=Lachancea thermotolerans (strain ATCC 56472 / CBS 6340 / NRRL Y-8284) TaxID=559295 RepID=C5DKD5_LACTC|nr:KLTH0F03762p [Lachancea thermotolerans CBS 6340]CAR23936.1 KLTH0F03762p [Lachancea thermotolerans CBS 6340]